MARITGVGKGAAGFPEPGTPISKELASNRDRTMAVASKVVMRRESQELSASKGPIGSSAKALKVAKRSMLTWKGY